MARNTTPREEHRSFTVRIPESLYTEIGDLANADGMFVNTKVNQLIRLGLGRHVDLNAALARMLARDAISD